MNKATIKLKNTPEQIELIKATVSPNDETAMKARTAMAAFIGPVIQQILDLMGTARSIYTDWPYNEDDSPTFPLDAFYGTTVNEIKVWSQSSAGGLGTTQVAGLQELQLATYTIDGAVSFNEKVLRRGRLPYVSLGLNRLAQEVLVKSERNLWYIALKALAEARTNGSEHLIQTATADVLQLADFNNLLTLSKRLNRAFNGGTPDVAFSRGATDLYMSPEAMEEIRAMAYQPQNTRTGTFTSSGATAVPLPDSIRENIFNNAGATEIYGITLHEMLEFGLNERYNTIFDDLYSGSLTFGTGNQEIIVGVDKSREALLRPIAQKADGGPEFTTEVDDQWPKRAGKVGYFGKKEEGAVCIDARVLTGIIIQ